MNQGRFRKFSVHLLFLCCLLLIPPLPLLAMDFSADVIVEPKGEEVTVGKVFVKGDKVRQETVIEGESEVTIVRPDKQITWTISPRAKTYTETPYQPEDKGFEEWNKEKASRSKLVGEGTISGIPCKKYEDVQDGERIYYWVSGRLSFPLRVEDPDFNMEYRNIKEGPVDDSLFEIPAGYTRTAIPTPAGVEGTHGQ